MENEIRIYPPGQKTTDYENAKILYRAFPTSFRKAQDVLAATEKYVKKKGLFSTESSRMQKMQGECYKLAEALKKDDYMTDELKKKNGKINVLFTFFSTYSDLFPNWQEEYKALNRFIPQFFEDL